MSGLLCPSPLRTHVRGPAEGALIHRDRNFTQCGEICWVILQGDLYIVSPRSPGTYTKLKCRDLKIYFCLRKEACSYHLPLKASEQAKNDVGGFTRGYR